MERAGRWSPKAAAYASLNSANVPMSVRKHSVFTTSFSVAPASARRAATLAIVCVGLGGDSALDDHAVAHAALTGHDDEVTGADERAVRAERLVHAPRTWPDRGRSGEGLAAAARAGGVGVRDGEPGLLEAVLVVERGTVEELRRRGIDDDLDVLGRAEAGPARRRRRCRRRRTSRTRSRCNRRGARRRAARDPRRLPPSAAPDLDGGGFGEGDHGRSSLDTVAVTTLSADHGDLAGRAVDERAELRHLGVAHLLDEPGHEATVERADEVAGGPGRRRRTGSWRTPRRR